MSLPQLPARTFALRWILLPCFFVSGACGLIYQIAWLRMLGLVFGNTTLSTCTVLAGYMAGLGFGALYFGRRIDTRGNAVFIYALLELGVGLYAFITPELWKVMEWVYVSFYRGAQPGFLPFSLFRFAIAFLFLFPPTFLMGGTLPVITKHFVGRNRDAARTVGLLYALNTLGAVLGVYLCGFYMLYILGVWQTVLLAGTLNILIFYGCYSFPAEPIPEFSAPIKTMEASDGTRLNDATVFWLLALFGVSGGVSMVYEIGWTRVLAISLGSSVYAFSTMLATFLLGIALGSYGFSLYSTRRQIGFSTFAFLEILTAIFVFWGLNRFDDLPYNFVQIYTWSSGHTGLLDLGRFLLCSVVMLPPTLCIGALFACFIQVYQHARRSQERQVPGTFAVTEPDGSVRIGTDVGKAYFANTLGTIIGSIVTGFVLIPIFGIQKTIIGGAWINAAIGLIVFGITLRSFSWKRVMIIGLLSLVVAASAWAVEPWNKTLLSSDTAVNPSRVQGLSRREFVQSLRERELIFYKEGSSATVTVTRLRDDLSLAVNGKTDASTNDAFTQFLLGHLPLILKPEAKKVLVIGLGSGSTLAAVASHPVEVIDAVEIEKSVVDAAQFFSNLNRNVLKDPRVHIFNNDGRNFVLLRPDQYDVMISEPSNPWMAGVANLFSLEHYQTMRKRLNPGGVVCQWLHAYSMSTRDLKMIINTFAQAFPEVSLWTSYYPDLMLMGSNQPLTIDFRAMEEVFKRPHVVQDLQPYATETPAAFFANFWLGNTEIRKLSKGGEINSDNSPILEFSAPRYLYSHTLLPNFKFLKTYRTMELPPISNLEPPLEKNSGFYLELARGYLAKHFLLEAIWAVNQARRIQPDSPQVAVVDGLIMFQRQQSEAAKEFFLKAVSTDPENAEAQYHLGLIARDQKDLAHAYLYLNKAVSLVPGQKKYLRDYFALLCVQGDLLEAAKIYSKLKSLGEVDFELMNLMADLTFKKAEPKAQALMAQSLIDNYPRFSPAYVHLGGLLEKYGAPSEALKVYQQMVKQLPGESRAYLLLAQVYATLHKSHESKQALKTAMRLDPTLRHNPEVMKVLNAM